MNTGKEASGNLSEVRAGEADKLYRGRYLEASPARYSSIKETSSSPVVESIVRTITGSRGLLSIGAAALLAAPVAAFVLPAGTVVPVILTVVQLAASKFMFSRLAAFRKGLEVSDEEGGVKNLKIFNALDVLYKGIAAFAFTQLFLYWEVGLTASILTANIVLAAIAVRHPVAAKAVITGLYFVLAVGMLMSLMLSGGHASWAGIGIFYQVLGISALVESTFMETRISHLAFRLAKRLKSRLMKEEGMLQSLDAFSSMIAVLAAAGGLAVAGGLVCLH
ncbi:MAG: hypothetical protein KAS66_14530, partial [Candidatus Omnitrophica bacterium]|nr:hypothetical protein [Candidatus Omnitrophota bacterium]